METIRRKLLGLISGLAILAAPLVVATPTSAGAAAAAPMTCPATSWGTVPIPEGEVSTVHTVAADTAGLLAPTGSGGWYGVRPIRSGSWPLPADLVTTALGARPSTRVLARVSYWVLGVTVDAGLVVNESNGEMTAYRRNGTVAWRVRIGGAAASHTDDVSLKAVGSDVLALSAPNVGPSSGRIVGVDAATGRVNLRAVVPGLESMPGPNPTADLTCAAGTLYVVDGGEPVFGHPIKPGEAPPQASVLTAVSTATGRVLWQRKFVTQPPSQCDSQVFWPPYATASGLLWFADPALCPQGTGKVRMRLLAPGTGHTVWQISYPWSFGSAVSNGSQVAVPLAGGAVQIRSYRTGRVLRTFRISDALTLTLGTSRSVAAVTCATPQAPKGCVPRTAVFTWAGRRTVLLRGGTPDRPWVEADGRLYVGEDAAVVVYRLH